MDAIGRAATARAERPRHEQSAYHLKHPPEGVVLFRPSTSGPDGPLPDHPRWSGASLPLPAIGARVNVFDMRKGPGVVTGYFVEQGWVGLHVRLDKPVLISGKAWSEISVFGIDLEPNGGRVPPIHPLEYSGGSGPRSEPEPTCDICGQCLGSSLGQLRYLRASVHAVCYRRAILTLSRIADACGQPDDVWAERMLPLRIRHLEDSVEISTHAAALASSPLAPPTPSECSEVASRDPVLVLGPGGDFQRAYGAVDASERDRLRGIITTGLEGGEG